MEMETSTEPMGPLTPSVATLASQPEGGCGEQNTSQHSLLAAQVMAAQAWTVYLVF